MSFPWWLQLCGGGVGWDMQPATDAVLSGLIWAGAFFIAVLLLRSWYTGDWSLWKDPQK